jgi:hypothetical protein
MAKLDCSTIRPLVLGVLVLGVLIPTTTSSSWAQTPSPVAEKIAKTYGLDSWGQVEAIRYTWNGEITGLFKVARTWTWEPKTGMVTYEGPDKSGKPVKVTYNSNQLGSQPDNVKNEIEPGFINDQYWALFPFHAAWDTSATVTDQGIKKLPIGAGSARLVSVKYPAEAGGFTPGDTWDLYVGKITASSNLSIIAVVTRNRASSPQSGQAIKRPALSYSQQTTPAPPMASLCTSSFRTWLLR